MARYRKSYTNNKYFTAILPPENKNKMKCEFQENYEEDIRQARLRGIDVAFGAMTTLIDDLQNYMAKTEQFAYIQEFMKEYKAIKKTLMVDK